VDSLGDIKLNGKHYRINTQSYRRRDVVDFSPRSGTPGGSTLMGELGLFQPMMQTDWRHGFGANWYVDNMAYMRTEGNVDTRHEGIALMYTTSVSSDTNNAVKEGFCTWNNALWTWGIGGLRKCTSGTTWTAPYTTATVNFAFPCGDYLFYCPDGLRIQKVNTSDAHSDAGNDSASIDFKGLIAHSGYVYSWIDGTNQIHRDSNADLSKLEGTTADTNIIYAGASNSPIIGMAEYAGYLYAARDDGLWQLGEDLIARRMLDFSAEASADNFRGMSVFNGYLLFPIRDKVYQWNGARLSDVTPPRLTDSFPYTTYGRFDNFVAMGKYLYCTARTNETTYSEDLICYDGVAWFKLARLVDSSTADTITAMGYDTINDYLWYHKDATADVTYYIRNQPRSDLPYANFPTTGTHELIFSRWDMGYRRVKKSCTSVLFESSNCTSTRYLTLYYALDGGSWIKWADIKTNGVTELTLPGGGQSVEFNYITLKVQFTTATATESPILEGLTLRFIMRPKTVLGWAMVIPLAKGMDIGELTEGKTTKQILSDLDDARNSEAPIEFIDVAGSRYNVYISSKSEQLIEIDRDGMGNSIGLEYVSTLSVVEAK
jgi:hypothetical protein